MLCIFVHQLSTDVSTNSQQYRTAHAVYYLHGDQLVASRQHDQRVAGQLVWPQVEDGPVEAAAHTGRMVDVARHQPGRGADGPTRAVHKVVDELACMQHGRRTIGHHCQLACPQDQCFTAGS